MNKQFSSFLLGLILLAPSLKATAISVYLSEPAEQSTFVIGATTETFDSASAGTYQTYVGAIGAYGGAGQDSFVIQAADQFGGANGTQYMTFGAQSGNANPIPLTLTSPATYFGFWWSAGDANNGLTFYDGANVIGRFSTATILSLLQSPTVTAVNGSTYQSSSYFGNPNNATQDTSEHFAYVNFVASGGTISSIVFDNSGATGSGFENDNHSVYNGAVTIAPTAVFVSTFSTPEPATWALLLGGLCVLAGVRWRRPSATLDASKL
jgi:PEP-CTERM motif